MAKWPNHFISGKQFQKRPNGNPGSSTILKRRRWKMVFRNDNNEDDEENRHLFRGQSYKRNLVGIKD